ncbi:3354_t:CDS:2, partial [Entrophospora sp. SA101]
GFTKDRVKEHRKYKKTLEDVIIHLFQEVIDNSIDEAVAGYCSEVKITLSADQRVITVEDNGRGIPIAIHPDTKKSTFETIFTFLHSGGIRIRWRILDLTKESLYGWGLTDQKYSNYMDVHILDYYIVNRGGIKDVHNISESDHTWRIQAIETDKAHNENKDSLAKVRIGRCADTKGTLAKAAISLSMMRLGTPWNSSLSEKRFTDKLMSI